MGKGSGGGSGPGYYVKGGQAALSVATSSPSSVLEFASSSSSQHHHHAATAEISTLSSHHRHHHPQHLSRHHHHHLSHHHHYNNKKKCEEESCRINIRNTTQPKGLTNVGNTCYANAVLQCLLSTALTHALLDPNAVNIFRHYSFNLQILQKGSGSVDSEDLNVIQVVADPPSAVVVMEEDGDVDTAAAIREGRGDKKQQQQQHPDADGGGYGAEETNSSIVTDDLTSSTATSPSHHSGSCTAAAAGGAGGAGCISAEKELERRERQERREKRRKDRDDELLQDRCQWLTQELKTITMEYYQSSSSSSSSSATATGRSQTLLLPATAFASWFTGCPTTPVVNPGTITKYPHRLSTCLRPYQQEDAHEFLRALLSTLVMNGQNKKLSSLFDGLLESSVTCQTCLRPSLTRDRYMDLSLDIHGAHIETLEDALVEFTKTETLTDDNKVYCSKCECKRTATKGLRLATAPSILVCHFKRFAFNQYGGLVRLSKHVAFPLQLEIGDYMSNLNQSRPPPYELVAVLVHQGQSCDSGHYVAYVKSGGQWYCCNDSQITSVDVGKVMSQQAYIVMYEVAEMRERHGYPSPSGASAPSPQHQQQQHHRNPSVDLSFLGMLCAVNDSILRDLCGGTTNNTSTSNNTAVSHSSTGGKFHRKKDRSSSSGSEMKQRDQDRRQSRSQEPRHYSQGGGASNKEHVSTRVRASSAILTRHQEMMMDGGDDVSCSSGAGDLATHHGNPVSSSDQQQQQRIPSFRRATSSTDLQSMQQDFVTSCSNSSMSPKGMSSPSMRKTMSVPRQRPPSLFTASDPGVQGGLRQAAAAVMAANSSCTAKEDHDDDEVNEEEEGVEQDLVRYKSQSGSGSPSSKERWASSNSPTYHSGERPPRPHQQHRRRNSSALQGG